MIKLGIIMDPINSINIKKDSSFAILLNAQNRGYKIYYMELNSLYLYNNEAYASTRLLSLKQDDHNWYNFYDSKDIQLNELDVILMRKNPPFNTEFIYATYILEYAQNKNTLIINNPQSLRDCNEKLFVTWFKKYAPFTLISRQDNHIRTFMKKHGDIILKPLDNMGGASVFYVKHNDPNITVIIETITDYGNRFCMVQNYLPEVKQGDKRVLMIYGNPIPYCLVRFPKIGEIRSNLAVGGVGKVQTLNDNDLEIANNVGPILKEKGLMIVGLDIIGKHLTEINVTSPTCIQEIEAIYPISITSILMDAIEQQLSTLNVKN